MVPTPLQAQPLETEVSVVRGTVTHHPGDGSKPAEVLTPGDGIRLFKPGDRVEVAGDSEALIEGPGFEGEVDAGSTVSRLAIQPAPNLGYQFKLWVGRIRARVDPQYSQRTQIETKSGTAAVKGTELDIQVLPDQSTQVQVAEGAVELLNPTFGFSVLLQPEDLDATLRHSGSAKRRKLRDNVLWIATAQEAADALEMRLGDSELVAEPGTALRVAVDDDGEFEVEVERGAVFVATLAQTFTVGATATIPAAGMVAAGAGGVLGAVGTAAAAGAGVAAGTVVAQELEESEETTTSPSDP